MLRNEAAHPANQSKDEKLGALAGGIVASSCSNCGAAFENGDHVRRYATFSAPSIYHGWSGRAVFCEDCNVYDVDDLPEGTNGANATNAIIVGGVFYDNGRKQKFCPMYLKDERISDEGRYEVPNDETGIPRFRKYGVSIDGETIEIPERIFRAVICGEESTEREDVPGINQTDAEYLATLLRDYGFDLDSDAAALRAIAVGASE